MGLQITARPFAILLIAFSSAAASVPDSHNDVDMNYRLDTVVENPSIRVDSESTTDHSKLKLLQGPFENGRQVTQACLECHTEAGHQFSQNIHWTWQYENPRTGQKLGKSRLVNNFCTNARGNEGMCAQCHAGYGWKDEDFDFNDQSNMDCVVCHDRSGTYYKTPNSTGNKACSVMFEGKQPIDWARVAQSVGMPARENCGGCHFYGGGGDGVKHGDLDSSLIHPDRELDVHMDEKGLNFACTTCHVTSKHIWAGSRYDVIAKDGEGTGKPGLRRDVATCESCHDDDPHDSTTLTGMKLNHHVKQVACQTCHIPTFARGGVATKTDWDWRTAGKIRDGEGYKEKNYTQGNGVHRATYKSIKGDFVYGENLVPEYHWFNGQMNYTTIDTRFPDNAESIDINGIGGMADDPGSRIWPFKKMHTVQPYDKGNDTLVYMHLWGDDEDSYWGNYDFGRAIKTGMEKNDLPYSGDYGFIDTYSYWPITHMVAPKEKALECDSCHADNGRLEGVEGLYMPGRDKSVWLDRIGIMAFVLALLGVLAHGGFRMLSKKKSNTGGSSHE